MQARGVQAQTGLHRCAPRDDGGRDEGGQVPAPAVKVRVEGGRFTVPRGVALNVRDAACQLQAGQMEDGIAPRAAGRDIQGFPGQARAFCPGRTRRQPGPQVHVRPAFQIQGGVAGQSRSIRDAGVQGEGPVLKRPAP